MMNFKTPRALACCIALTMVGTVAGSAFATVICETEWPANIGICSSGGEQAVGYSNNGSYPIGNCGSVTCNRLYQVNLNLGVNRARGLPLDASGNTIGSCPEVVDYPPVDQVATVAYCFTSSPPTDYYVWAQ